MNKKQVLYCSECGNQLTNEQLNQLYDGIEILCEKCGKKFQTKTIKISSSDKKSYSYLEEKFHSIGLNVKKGSKNLKDKSKKVWNRSKKLKKKLEKNIQDKYHETKGIIKAQIDSSDKESYSSSSSSKNEDQSSQKSYNNSNSRYRRYGQTSRSSQPSWDNPPPLSPKYSYFRRMNIITASFALIHIMIIVIITIMQIIPDISQGGLTYSDELLLSGLRIGVGFLILFYDLFYVRKKIEDRDLRNYGIDFIIIGILGSIFGYGIGLYLTVKGIIVMFIAITNSAVFSWRYDRSFGEVLTSLTNLFASVIGFVILAATNPLFIAEINLIYFYMALGALLLDLLILRPIVKNRKLYDVPLIIALLKLVCGVIASFHYLSGAILVIEGIFMTFSALFREEQKRY